MSPPAVFYFPLRVARLLALALAALLLSPAAIARATNEDADAKLPPPGGREFVIPGFPGVRLPSLRYKMGDDPAWARPDLDDSDWNERGFPEGLPARTGVYWVRFPVRFDRFPALKLDAIAFAVVASYELYIDGQLVGRSGRVGADREEEIPGNVDEILRVPDALLTPGEHLVALRMSAWRSGFPSDRMNLNMAVGNYRELIERRTKQAFSSVLAFGGAVVVGIVFALLWLLVDRRRVIALLSLLCLTAAVFQALQAWRWLHRYPFDWHYPRLTALAVTMGVLCALFALCMKNLLEVPRRHMWAAFVFIALAAAWLVSPLHNAKSATMGAIAVGSGLSSALWAIKHRRPGAKIILGTLLVSLWVLLDSPRDFIERSFYLSFGAPIFGSVAVISLRLRDERRAAQQAQLTAARLEAELLKKNIQPHFILNTLTTLMEVIEHEPKTAVTLIEALGGEFRILARISCEKLVPLGQELELCRTHLRIMSVRRALPYTLGTEGVDERALIPPALFLTLLENGLTHASAASGATAFRLRAETIVGETRYMFFAPGESPSPSEKKTPPLAAEPDAHGTGLRYVRARLEESFPSAWSLRNGPVAGGWETVIEIRRSPAPAHTHASPLR